MIHTILINKDFFYVMVPIFIQMGLLSYPAEKDFVRVKYAQILYMTPWLILFFGHTFLSLFVGNSLFLLVQFFFPVLVLLSFVFQKVLNLYVFSLVQRTLWLMAILGIVHFEISASPLSLESLRYGQVWLHPHAQFYFFVGITSDLGILQWKRRNADQGDFSIGVRILFWILEIAFFAYLGHFFFAHVII